MRGPGSCIIQGDVFHSNAFTAHDPKQKRTTAPTLSFRPCIPEDMLFLQLRSLSIDRTLAFNADVLCIHGHDQRPSHINAEAFCEWIKIAVGFDVCTAQQTSAFVK